MEVPASEPEKDKLINDGSSATEYSVSSVNTKKINKKPSAGASGGERYVQLKVPSLPKIPRWPFSRLSTVLVIVGFLLSLGFGFLGGWIGARENNGVGIFSSSGAPIQEKIVTKDSQLISSIAKAVGPSVVSVDVTGQQQAQPNFFGFTQTQQVQSAGTGIIISSDGLIVTNRHVVPAGTTSVSVTLSDGTQLNDVEVVGRTNSNDSLDIAFLKIKDAKGEKLTPAAIGDSSNVQVGDSVVAIGNALGQFQNTVTSGIISGYGRQVQASNSTGTSSENLADLFQTDAAINEGNSGGPLVNMNGQVIGINTAIAGNAQSIGFAIPINDVTGLIKQVETTGKLQRPYLGVRYIPLTADIASKYNLSVNHGAYIVPSTDPTQPSIISGSPADKAGIKEKDVIVQINGTNIDQSHSLVSLIDQHSVGDTLDLTILRDGKTMHVSVKLTAAPSA